MKQATEPSAPKRKRVLFVITKATWGGAQKYVFDLSTHLPEEFEPVVAFGQEGKLSTGLAAAKIRTYPLPALQRDVAIWSDIQSFFQILKCIRDEKPDVVHLNSSKAAAIGALAARLAGARNIVFTVHGWPFKESRNVLARSMIRSVSWLTAALSHSVIVVSKTDETFGLKMPFVRNKIRYIPIGIDAPVFLTREDAAAKFSVTTTSPRIVTIAELTANKGIACAIEAVSVLKRRGTDVSYFIIGDGEEQKRLQELAQKLGVADRVYFLGFVENAAQYLKAFDVFALPSLKEGSPYVLLEAESAGLPIVATSAVDSAYSLRVETGDVNALADAFAETRNMQISAAVPFTLGGMLEQTVSVY